MGVTTKANVMSIIQGGTSSLFRMIDQSVIDVVDEFSDTVEGTVNTVHESLTSKTPVYSGQTVRNYRWSVGSPYSGPALEALGTEEPGNTGSMPLGTEPRRSANEEDSAKTLRLLDFKNPFKAFYVTNKSPAISGLEKGELPTEGRSRSPKGMFLITEMAVNTKLRSTGKPR